MTLDEYNEAVKQIFAEQQNIAQLTAQLAMSGQASPANPQFVQIMTKQWGLVQQMAKLNTDLCSIMARRSEIPLRDAANSGALIVVFRRDVFACGLAHRDLCERSPTCCATVVPGYSCRISLTGAIASPLGQAV